MVDEIKRYYSEWWENPADIRNMVFEGLNEYVRKRIPRGRGKKALDIGSGHGSILSYLLEKGYDVTAIEFNGEFAKEIKGKFPQVKVIDRDIRDIEFEQRFDVATCIELVQNLNREELHTLLTKLAKTTKSLLINISNQNSFHARWVELCGWRKWFVHNYTPRELDLMLEQAGFEIVHRRGIGLITPVSLFGNFKGKLIPVWVSKIVNRLDSLFPEMCHLYYVEAVSNAIKTPVTKRG